MPVPLDIALRASKDAAIWATFGLGWEDIYVKLSKLHGPAFTQNVARHEIKAIVFRYPSRPAAGRASGAATGQVHTPGPAPSRLDGGR